MIVIEAHQLSTWLAWKAGRHSLLCRWRGIITRGADELYDLCPFEFLGLLDREQSSGRHGQRVAKIRFEVPSQPSFPQEPHQAWQKRHYLPSNGEQQAAEEDFVQKRFARP